jgi:hypothetical protein
VYASKSWSEAIGMIITIYPIMFIASLYCTWLLAWHELGFLPQPKRDDPKFMGWPVRFAHWVTWWLASMFSHAWIATVIFVPTASRAAYLRI